jgi:5-bromo-4-chloroindolyl phosphate hydrolysis protein.
MNMEKKRIRSALPLYMAAAVWLLAGLIAPRALLHLGTLAVVAVISAAAGFLGEKLFPGKIIEERARADSGDARINAQIEEGRAQLDALRAINDDLPDPEITKQLNRMQKAGEAIFDALEKDTGKANDVRRFMNYYLPTCEKVMLGYRELAKSPVRGENITSAMQSVESSLSLIADAFEKQLDSLYRDKSFDMSADVQVLETVLSSEGLTAQKGAVMQAGQNSQSV